MVFMNDIIALLQHNFTTLNCYGRIAMNTTVLIIVLGLYFAGMLVIGLIGKKKVGSDFNKLIGVGKTTTVLMFMGAAIGGHVGNGFVVGGAAGGAADGISGAWYGLVCALSYVFILLFFNKKIYQKGFISLADFLREKYRNDWTAILFIVATCIGLIGNIGVQLMAGKAMFEALGLDGRTGVIILTLVVLAYSALSGLWGAFMTSAFQIGIIVVGLIITTIVLLANGAPAAITAAFAAGKLPETYFTVFPNGVWPVAAMLISISMAVIADQCTVQRINSAKDYQTTVKGWIYSILLMIPLALMPTFVGMYGAATYGLTDNSVFFTVAMNSLPAVVGAILMAAVLSAIMSTIDAFMVGISTMLLHDVYQGILKKESDNKTLSRWNYIINIAVAAIGLVVALAATNIVDTLCSTTAFIGAGCFIPFVGALFWKKGTAKGAIAASAVGMIAMILHWTGIVTLPLDEVGGALCSLVAFIIVSMLTQKDNEV